METKDIGSPPPMRGKGRFLCTEHPPSRITPAYAGKRCLAAYPVARTRDHPRLCGEKITIFRCSTRDEGSPPPMRGKVFRLLMPANSLGITPAYAGKSHSLNPINIRS